MTTSFNIKATITVSREVELPDTLDECRTVVGAESVIRYVQDGMQNELRHQLRYAIQEIANDPKLTGQKLMEYSGFRNERITE